MILKTEVMCCARLLAWLKGAGRMPVHPLTARVVGPAVVCIVVSMLAWAPGISDEGLLIVSAQAQRAQKSPADQLRSQMETLINRLRGRDMPEGIVKSNGRIEPRQRRRRMLRPTPNVTRLTPRSRPPRPKSSGCRLFWSTWCSCRQEVEGCSTGLPAPARWLPQDSGF